MTMKSNDNAAWHRPTYSSNHGACQDKYLGDATAHSYIKNGAAYHILIPSSCSCKVKSVPSSMVMMAQLDFSQNQRKVHPAGRFAAHQN